MRSLKEWGQVKPIVLDTEGQVIAGNGTLESAKRLGWKHIAVVKTKLSGAQAEAYAIADNKTTDMSEFDYEALSSVMHTIQGEGIDLDLTGFQSFETQPLLQAEWTPPAAGEMPEEGPSTSGKHYHLFLDTDQWSLVQQAIEYAREHYAEEYDVKENADALAAFCLKRVSDE